VAALGLPARSQVGRAPAEPVSMKAYVAHLSRECTTMITRHGWRAQPSYPGLTRGPEVIAVRAIRIVYATELVVGCRTCGHDLYRADFGPGADHQRCTADLSIPDDWMLGVGLIGTPPARAARMVSMTSGSFARSMPVLMFFAWSAAATMARSSSRSIGCERTSSESSPGPPQRC